jgi:hypothetical protein
MTRNLPREATPPPLQLGIGAHYRSRDSKSDWHKNPGKPETATPALAFLLLSLLPKLRFMMVP